MSGTKPAVVFEDQTVSWAELWNRVERASQPISRQLGTESQQVVALLMPNSLEYIVSYLAVVHSGHIAMPLDPAYKRLELDAILDQIPPKLLIIDSQSTGQLNPRHRGMARLYDELQKSSDKAGKQLRLPPVEQIASLTFTSGTTGKPKAVPYTHANHIWNIKVCSQVWDWTPNDSLLVTVPLSHFNGVVMALSGAIYHGNTIHLHRWFDEQATMEALASGEVTMFNHAASAYVKLVAVPKANYDLSKVRLCTSGAAPLPPAVWREFKDLYGIEILETYGSSETGRIAGNRLDKRVSGSPGRPFPGVEVRLNKRSELEVRSDGVFPGYYKNPAATAASQTADGFWQTGDIAEIKDGYIYLKGREQENIRRFGYTISPRDVEWAMHQHPKIRDVYAMGIQRPGEPNDELVYFIVTDLTDEEIRAYAKANLLFAWRPDRIVHLEDLPRTRSGKPSIDRLKELVA